MKLGICKQKDLGASKVQSIFVDLSLDLAVHTMSSTEAPAADKTNETEKTGENEKSTNESNETNASQNNNKPIKKVKSKKDLKNDPSRFDSPGVNFNAKLIGIDDVENARGDKMCQESMYRLKIAVKQSGQHKPKITINVSLDGIRIVDLKTHAVNHTHPVHRISFISRDITDHRAFGYVFGAGEGKHKFFAIKTEKAAEALVLTLRDLFQVVYELKKKEVEDAKHKVDEPAEEATEDKENKEDPVYSVPTNGKPVENEADPTYQVPNNNQPVNEAPDLLQMESELEVIERRIEQIDTMEELFKELEAPPTTTQAPAPASSASPWSSDLAGLSMTQTQPAFSIGGSPFPNNQQPFSAGMNNPFPPTSQPFGQPAQAQPFGQPAQSQAQPFGQPAQAQPFGQVAFPASGFPPQQVPGMQPFQPPSVPPRTGAGFPQQPNQFPGTPFAPQQQQAAFGVPAPAGVMVPPGVRVTPPNDPFGADPFAGNDEEDVLTPLSLQTPAEEVPVTKPSDAFGDLVSIGGTQTKKSPKELFVDLATPTKKSLNELKAPKSPKSPKSASPVSFQASDDKEEQTDIFNPFGTSDPFANDPFSTSVPSHNISSNTNKTVLKNDDNDDFNIPLPRGPPPPLPDFISSQPPGGPLPPPRPPVESCKFPQELPPVPPRPLSASSESKNSSGSLSSLNESQTVGPQMTPPLPPRPTNNVVPRPRPRPRPSKTNDTLTNLSSQSNTQISFDQNVLHKTTVINTSDKSVKLHGNTDSSDKISDSRISHDTSITSFNSESHSDSDSNHSVNKARTSSVVVDPFVSTDPFASDDPFTLSDPFANDPFNPDPFADTSVTQPVPKDDPFTSVVRQKHEQSTDPFSVFDNTVSNETFKFEKSSSRKTRTKISGI
ncbi:leading edge cell differentiation [Mactra antiquata]